MSILPGIYASQITGHLVTNSYESIQTVTVGAGGASSISFTSIPSTFKHLQIRGIGRADNANTGVGGYLQINSDTGTNYVNHYLDGNGASVTAGALLSETRFIFGGFDGATAASGMFGASITDLLDYANTNKNKVGRTLTGNDRNGSGSITFYSSMWLNTAAITRLDIYPTAGNWVQYSSFAIYGIRG